MIPEHLHNVSSQDRPCLDVYELSNNSQTPGKQTSVLLNNIMESFSVFLLVGPPTPQMYIYQWNWVPKFPFMRLHAFSEEGWSEGQPSWFTKLLGVLFFCQGSLATDFLPYLQGPITILDSFLVLPQPVVSLRTIGVECCHVSNLLQPLHWCDNHTEECYFSKTYTFLNCKKCWTKRNKLKGSQTILAFNTPKRNISLS